jgi:hypothetical protein
MTQAIAAASDFTLHGAFRFDLAYNALPRGRRILADLSSAKLSSFS